MKINAKQPSETDHVSLEPSSSFAENSQNECIDPEAGFLSENESLDQPKTSYENSHEKEKDKSADGSFDTRSDSAVHYGQHETQVDSTVSDKEHVSSEQSEAMPNKTKDNEDDIEDNEDQTKELDEPQGPDGAEISQMKDQEPEGGKVNPAFENLEVDKEIEKRDRVVTDEEIIKNVSILQSKNKNMPTLNKSFCVTCFPHDFVSNGILLSRTKLLSNALEFSRENGPLLLVSNCSNAYMLQPSGAR